MQTKRVKIREASFNQLSYMVSILEMPHLLWGETIGIHHASDQIVVPELKSPDCYSPFTNWKMFGPIIERENITLERNVKQKGCSVIGFCDWYALHPKNFGGLIRYSARGATALIAAMRCYAASKLGDVVEVPDELVLTGN